nr:MAG TPA: hypothetical protein [Bacteriophage sp.]
MLVCLKSILCSISPIIIEKTQLESRSLYICPPKN